MTKPDEHAYTPTLTLRDPEHDGQEVALEWYGGNGSESYYKGKRPGGGTIEVHFLRESFIDNHPNLGDEEE